MIKGNKVIEKWWNELGVVPIMKKGQLPDYEQFTGEDGEEISDIDETLATLGEKKGLITIPKEMLGRGSEFISCVRSDREILENIYEAWFGDNSRFKDSDPKTDDLAKRIKLLLKENSDRKIVIFSSYADTVNYLARGLKERGIKKLLKYTAADASATRKKVKENFDASLLESAQKNDYDVLIATDALSEG
jgi:superfamily II DNA or RNA helicase